jgi:hypothetical protein
MSALVKAAGMTDAKALAAIADSPAWKNDLFTQHWIDPPTLPERGVLDRMASVCAQEPQILEAWITGGRMTRSDGSFRENTGVTLVLDLPSGDPSSDEQSLVLAEKLSAVAPEFDIGHWRFTADKLTPDVEDHGLKIYPSGTPPA